MIQRIKIWNKWRQDQFYVGKHIFFTPFEQILILLGIRTCFSFDWYLTFYEEDKT